MAKKKGNPQDSTLRNVRASRAQVKFVREWLTRLDARCDYLETELRALRQRNDLSEDFATAQRRLGYKHSTSAPNIMRTVVKP